MTSNDLVINKSQDRMLLGDMQKFTVIYIYKYQAWFVLSC